MTEKKSSKGKATEAALTIPAGHPWDNAWKIFAAIGAVGLLASAAGYSADHKRFGFSYLFAFEVFLTIGLGSVFFVLMQHLTSAGWSVTVRRTSEFLATGLFALIVLFVPVYALKGDIFPWLSEAHHEGGHEVAETHTTAAQTHAHEEPSEPSRGVEKEHEATPGHGDPTRGEGGPHEGHAGHEGALGPHPGMAHGGMMHANATGGDPNEVEEHHVLESKKPYLNVQFFSIRAVFYLLAWAFIAWRLFRYSVDQDSSKDPKLTVAVQRFAPPATIVFALTLTFAGFDWIMSLEPTWFSTIFGVYCFAGCVLAGLTTVTLATMAMRRAGLLKDEVNAEHYHDLGKLTFGFLIFWAYIGFSQFMLIWYAALPEETTFFHNRWDHGPWAMVSMLLLVAHFVFPFFLLLSRNVKRRLQIMGFGAAWILLMHVVDIYWLVMPAFGQDGFSFHWLDATCLIGIGGVYLAVVFFFMRKHRLIPVGDPRLLRAIHFENA